MRPGMTGPPKFAETLQAKSPIVTWTSEQANIVTGEDATIEQAQIC